MWARTFKFFLSRAGAGKQEAISQDESPLGVAIRHFWSLGWRKLPGRVAHGAVGTHQILQLYSILGGGSCTRMASRLDGLSAVVLGNRIRFPKER